MSEVFQKGELTVEQELKGRIDRAMRAITTANREALAAAAHDEHLPEHIRSAAAAALRSIISNQIAERRQGDDLDLSKRIGRALRAIEKRDLRELRAAIADEGLPMDVRDAAKEALDQFLLESEGPANEQEAIEQEDEDETPQSRMRP